MKVTHPSQNLQYGKWHKNVSNANSDLKTAGGLKCHMKVYKDNHHHALTCPICNKFFKIIYGHKKCSWLHSGSNLSF